jgi:outer membrane protein OmpA-like peptidoglycan-associated protein
MAFYRANTRLDDNFTSVIPYTDEYNEAYELRTTVNRYEEKQSALMLSIPLTAQYQTSLRFWGRRSAGGRRYFGQRFYARAGFRLDIPLSERYRAASASLINERYYPALDIALREPTYKGLGEFTGRSAKGNLNLNSSLAGMVEAGVKWDIVRQLSFYTGLYFSCGLTGAVKSTHSGDFMLHSEASPADFSTGSVLASQYEQGKPFTNRVTLMSAGLTVRLAFGTNSAGRRRSQGLTSDMSLTELLRWLMRRKEAIDQQREMAAAQELQRELLEAQLRMRRKMEDMQRSETLAMLQERRQQQQLQRQQQLLQTELQRQQTEQELQQKTLEARRLQAERHQGEDPCAKLRRIIEQPINSYSVSQSKLSPTQISKIKKMVELLSLNPSIKIICTGHACSIGDAASKEQISLLRAKSIKDYLVQHGIDEERIEVLGESDRVPVTLNTNERNRQKNRRVEILIMDANTDDSPCMLTGEE